MQMMRTALTGFALGLGLLLSLSTAEARGGFGGVSSGSFHSGVAGGGGTMFFPHRTSGLGPGGFVMHGHPGFARIGMGPGRPFGAMRFQHANFHDFHDRRFRHFHRNFFFPFFVANAFPYGYDYYDYGYGGCGWAYRNARATGSPYWWNRYYACIGYSY